jgi:hypothetical protein
MTESTKGRGGRPGPKFFPGQLVSVGKRVALLVQVMRNTHGWIYTLFNGSPGRPLWRVGKRVLKDESRGRDA